MSATSSLAYLPTELYEAILDQIDPTELQKVTLALRLALPRSPVPLHQLFKHVRINSRPQVPKFWQRLEVSKKADGDRAAANWVQSFELGTFDVDADVLYNAIQLIPAIRYLHLNIGTTFAPEHLDELFRKPKPNLKCISLRFRPYVEKATYYQFLKGQYSDILVEHMTRWPSNPALTHLSMVQDPLPASSFNPQTSFAQPIVFFSLEVFRPFSASPLARHITHLRLRVPSRLVLAQLLDPGSFPALQTLDLATSSLGNPERALPLLLARHSKLAHLLLDDCSLSRETWRELARACALSGQNRSRAREKRVNEWLEAMSARQVSSSSTNTGATPVPGVMQGNNQLQRRGPRHGRRGVAAAAFSIRATPVTSQSQASSSSNINAPGNGDTTSGTAVKKTKIRILPPLPILLTFSTKLTPPPDAVKASEWRAEFESGWRGGVEVLLSARARLRTSAAASVTSGHIRVMRFANDADPLDSFSGDDHEEGLRGLVDVGLDDLDVWETKGSHPLVCFGQIRRGRTPTSSRVIDEDDQDESDRDENGSEYPHTPNLSGSDDSDAEPALVQPVATLTSTTPSLPKYMVREDGHAQGCGHELHVDSWNIYERFVQDL